jgi:hypothetical protein
MIRLALLLLSALLILGGCTGILALTDEVIQAKMTGKEGVVKVYPISDSQAWEISNTVFRWEKTDDVLENRSGNYLITSSGMQMVALGSVMGVWIEPAALDRAKITVITRHRDKGDMFTRLTAERFFQSFDQAVRILKSGDKLPLLPP